MHQSYNILVYSVTMIFNHRPIHHYNHLDPVLPGLWRPAGLRFQASVGNRSTCSFVYKKIDNFTILRLIANEIILFFHSWLAWYIYHNLSFYDKLLMFLSSTSEVTHNLQFNMQLTTIGLKTFMHNSEFFEPVR